MSADEPSEIRAGDPWAWRREDLADYPATLWTLAYWFKNQNGGFQLSAAADGVYYAIDESSDDTEGLVAGSYSWQARVTNIADNTIRHVVDSGTLQVLPNLFVGAAADPLDGRTHAQKVLDAIEATIEGRATLDQLEYTIGNRSLKRMTVDDLLKLRAQYRREVSRASGVSDTTYVRFNRV